MLNNEFISIDDFELGKPLGIGRFGQVWLARHKKNNFLCAIKILNRSLFKDNIDVKNLRREIEVHLNMRNKYILNMYGYFYDSKRIYCALEWAPGGDLWKYLHDYGHLSEEKASKLVNQLSQAIKYLHDHNIIHRDIKPENILLGLNDKKKLSSTTENNKNTTEEALSSKNAGEALNSEKAEEALNNKNTTEEALSSKNAGEALNNKNTTEEALNSKNAEDVFNSLHLSNPLHLSNSLPLSNPLHLLSNPSQGRSFFNDDNFNIKLCDFGWSVFNSDKKRATFCGTAEYLSPEMCLDKSYDKSADIWCLGILAFELCTGSTPFGTCKTIRLMKEKISDSDINFPAYLSKDTIDFIKGCCKKNPFDRIGLDEIFKHPFITKYYIGIENK